MDLLIRNYFILFKKLKFKQIKGKYSNISCNVLPCDHQTPRQNPAAKIVPYYSFKQRGRSWFILVRGETGCKNDKFYLRGKTGLKTGLIKIKDTLNAFLPCINEESP